MGRLIIHPGIGKTATSAIQEIGVSLINSDANLVTFSPHGLIKGVHNVFADNHPQFNAETFEIEFQKLIKYIQTREADVIISSEFLIFSSPSHISNMLGRIGANGIEVKVVFAIREYSNYLISSYLQAIKIKWGMVQGESIQDYSKRMLPLIRYPLLLDQWARVIGDENIFFIEYDKFKDTFVKLFFDFVNMQVNLENAKKKVNESIPLTCVDLILEFDKICSSAEKRLNLIHLLSTCKFDESAAKNKRQHVDAAVANTFTHDIERLNSRYNRIG